MKISYLAKALFQMFFAGIFTMGVMLGGMGGLSGIGVTLIIFGIPALAFGYFGVRNIMDFFSGTKLNVSTEINTSDSPPDSFFNKITKNDFVIFFFTLICLIIVNTWGLDDISSFKISGILLDATSGEGLIPGFLIFLRFAKPFFEVAALMLVLRTPRSNSEKILLSIGIVILFIFI